MIEYLTAVGEFVVALKFNPVIAGIQAVMVGGFIAAITLGWLGVVIRDRFLK